MHSFNSIGFIKSTSTGSKTELRPFNIKPSVYLFHLHIYLYLKIFPIRVGDSNIYCLMETYIIFFYFFSLFQKCSKFKTFKV